MVFVKSLRYRYFVILAVAKLGPVIGRGRQHKGSAQTTPLPAQTWSASGAGQQATHPLNRSVIMSLLLYSYNEHRA